jgi:1,2-phenylacetyl-CoA epoxidase PaaB subunit
VSREHETVWEVFARQAYEEPLHHVGTLTESDEDLALL